MRSPARHSLVPLTVALLVAGGSLVPLGAVEPKVWIVGGFGGNAQPKNKEAVLADAPTVYTADKVTSPSFRTRLLLQQRVKMDFPLETPLEDVLKHIRTATAGKDSKGLSIYVDPLGLEEAEQKMQAPVTLQVEGLPLAKTLRLVLSQIGMMYEVRDDGLVVVTAAGSNESAPQCADEWMRGEVEQLRAAVTALRTELSRSYSAIGAPGPVRKTQFRHASQTQQEDNDDLPDQAQHLEILRRLSHAATRSWLKLGNTIDFKAQEMSLEAALARFKEVTKGDQEPLQIYVDPVGLQEAEKTMASPLNIDLEGVRASSVLALMLKQLGLRFYLDDDGLVVITAESEDSDDPDARDLTTLNTLVALRHEVNTMRREMALLRHHRGASTAPTREAVPVSARVDR